MDITKKSGLNKSSEGKSLLPFFSKEEIEKRVQDLAEQIDAKYGEEPLVLICVLKGAFVFFSDLARKISNPNLELDFVRLSSYGRSTTSSGHVVFNKDAEIDIRGKHVLIVEDIVDSGLTMRFLCDQFKARNPLSIAIASLVDKQERRQGNIQVDFPGFVVDKGFLVGYGMDYSEKYRTLPDIYKLEN